MSKHDTTVHNHGPDEGPGLACREHRAADGRLRGECLGGEAESPPEECVGGAWRQEYGTVAYPPAPAREWDHPPVRISSRGVSSVRPADVLASRAGQEQVRASVAADLTAASRTDSETEEREPTVRTLRHVLDSVYDHTMSPEFALGFLTALRGRAATVHPSKDGR